MQWSIDEKAQKHEKEEKAAVAVAAEQAKTAADIAKNMDGKLDRLLVAVLEIQAQHKAEEKAKKEKK